MFFIFVNGHGFYNREIANFVRVPSFATSYSGDSVHIDFEFLYDVYFLSSKDIFLIETSDGFITNIYSLESFYGRNCS